MLSNVEALIGQIIGGYQLERVIGRGGTGAVFLARKVDAPEDVVALKLLIPPPQIPDAEREELRRRFLREIDVLQRLNHPHILPIRGFGEDAATGLAYMVLPYIQRTEERKGTLAARIAEGSIALAQAAEWLRQIAEALDYAHRQGIIHRDIKPENILLDANDQIFIADFGIIKLYDESLTALTITGQILGTPFYMAPEQGESSQITPAADIYSLGMVLFHLVTGQVAFQGTSPMAVMIKQMQEPPPSPRGLRPDLPAPAEAAILRALAKKPTDRFPTAMALHASFAAGLAGRWEGVTPPLPPMERPTSENATIAGTPTPLYPIGMAGMPSGQLASPYERPTAPPFGGAPSPFGSAPPQWPTPDGMPMRPPPAPQRRNSWLLPILAAVIVLGMGGLLFARLAQAQGTPGTGTVQPTPVPMATNTQVVLPTVTLRPTATARPTATMVPPTDTPVPIVSPHLGVLLGDCSGPFPPIPTGGNIYPPLIISNSGNSTMNWSATLNNAAQFYFDHANGNLAPGGSMTIYEVPLVQGPWPSALGVQVFSNGGNWTNTIAC